MMKRFFVLAILVVIGVAVAKNYDVKSLWQDLQVFVEENLGEGVLEEIKLGKLQGKRESLEKKLKELTEDLTEKVEEGTAKYKEIETVVIETKEAIEETQKAIEHLQDSVEESKEVLGL